MSACLRTWCQTLALIALLASSAFPALPGSLNVTDFGAKADGKTDNTAAFQRALDETGKKHCPLDVPPGEYLFSGHIRVPSGVTLSGSWQGPPSRTEGTVLLASEGAGSESGPAFITLEGAAGVKGLVIAYPNQDPEAKAPTPYPWTIRGLAQDCQVQDVLLVRSYQAIDFGTYPCSRHYINDLYGSALRRGIYVDGSVDVGRISNVHFSTWGFAYQGPLDKWKLANGEAFIVGKADWELFANCFALGYGTGFRFITGKGGNDKRTGPPNYVQIAHCGIDESDTPMIVENAAGITVSQSVFKGKAIRIMQTNEFPVKFSQCNFSPMPGTESLVMAHGKGRVSFTDCTFEFWDTVHGDQSPALLADCVSICVEGCEFGTDNRPAFHLRGNSFKRQIELTPKVLSAVIIGNRFRYAQNIRNRSRGNVAILGNVVDDFDAMEQKAGSSN